jgi:hypothetical protein
MTLGQVHLMPQDSRSGLTWLKPSGVIFQGSTAHSSSRCGSCIGSANHLTRLKFFLLPAGMPDILIPKSLVIIIMDLMRALMLFRLWT